VKPEFMAHAPTIEHVLDTTLHDLTGVVTTNVLAARIASRLLHEHDIRTLSLADIAHHLSALAPKHPHATHDGDTFYRFGRANTRWRWHPEPQMAETKLASEIAASEIKETVHVREALELENEALRERLVALEARIAHLEHILSEDLSDIL
jgi:hypothetical protein